MEIVQKRIVNAIQTHNTIIIHRHIYPDLDAIGSQAGLQRTLKNSFADKTVYAAGDDETSLLFINKMDLIPDEAYKESLVIVCDTADTSRICDQRFSKGATLIKIDHHPDHEPYGDLSWVDPSYSSASEMLVDLFLEYPEVFRMNKEAAGALYAGIIGDTGRMLNGTVSPRTLRAVKALRKFPFQPERIHNELNKKSSGVARLREAILRTFKVTEQGVAYIYLTEEKLAAYGVNHAEAANLVNVLSSMARVRIWIFFIEYPNEIRVRIRSRNIPIDDIARRFGGGGHSFAAGASIGSWEIADEVIEALNGKT
ncbi:DHH family phosphoesterase [Metabacillus idriensis]|uniref:DHH family phosphoesterase n=1 Tax=Metabacillus idriensis TaxID=324768 RepID=UPI0014781FB6|nr:bifunctional oligoribonuclease/PAP phosphatase NrnA [Metabacillus idriensis]